jgi:leucyl/phenylalanyl-tRNA---protein transferase
MPVFRLSEELIFPPVHLATPEGLLAVGGDLSPDRLLLAYKMGIFPWYCQGDPILWWSPDPRMVLYPEEINISRSLKKMIRQEKYQVTTDRDFEQVISACAKVRQDAGEGTWITREMVRAYCRLNQQGYAHSVESWHQGTLVGGLYGICLGSSFFGESMFSTMADASKVALVYLTRLSIQNDINLIDCQLPNDHLMRLGAREISRKEFIKQLRRSLQHPSSKGQWKN